MSTTALYIVQLIKSLPPADQQAVCAALACLVGAPNEYGPSASVSAFQPTDYEGLPDDDPFFKVIEEIEQQRHAYIGRPAPELD